MVVLWVARTLDELKERQRRFDDTVESKYNEAKAKYPEIDNIIPIVLDPVRGTVLKKGSKPTPIEAPLEVINAIRLRSLKHAPTAGCTCVKCEVKYDAYGYVVGALHYWVPDEDTFVELPDGTKARVEGLKTKIAQGKVRILSDYEVKVE